MKKARLGVLVSGNGSNLQALIDACKAVDYPAEIAVVISNIPEVFALERARSAGLKTLTLSHREFSSREDFDAQLLSLLSAHQVEWVCLSGFMRLLTPAFLKKFPQKVLNIHPSLLPAFPGIHSPRQALAYGVKIAGCTVHLVDEGTDSGPIVVQAAVAVKDEDTEASLAARILTEEHRIYPLAVRWMVEGKVTVKGRMVHSAGESSA